MNHVRCIVPRSQDWLLHVFARWLTTVTVQFYSLGNVHHILFIKQARLNNPTFLKKARAKSGAKRTRDCVQHNCALFMNLFLQKKAKGSLCGRDVKANLRNGSNHSYCRPIKHDIPDGSRVCSNKIHPLTPQCAGRYPAPLSVRDISWKWVCC